MKTKFSALMIASAVFALPSLHAQQVDITVINLTRGITFTPLLVSVHAADDALYVPGSAASAALQAMAEGGDLSALLAGLNVNNASVVENPAGGLLMPGAKTTAMVQSDAVNNRLSIVAMMLPTNDGFVALNNWPVPTTPGTYKVELNAHDAGTEANDEIINGAGMPGAPGIPAAPDGHGGSGGVGTGAVAEGYVHIHRGILGDHDATGGASDLDAAFHRWLNPVASVIVTVH